MNTDWTKLNQRHLSHAIAGLRTTLERREISADRPAAGLPRFDEAAADAWPAELPPPAIDTLCSAFALSPFERDILLLCAGVELDAHFASLCRGAPGNAERAYPTFGLGLAVLESAHWSALSPDGPLRRWRLIEVLPRDAPLSLSPLRIAERVLHYLTGVACNEESLEALITPVEESRELPPSQEAAAQRVADLITRADRGALPAVQLCGRAGGDKRTIAAAACDRLGLCLRAMRAADVSLLPSERLLLARVWEREAVLGNWALLVEHDEGDSFEQTRAATAFVESVRGVVLMATRETMPLGRRAVVRVDVARPTADEQRTLWHGALGSAADGLNGQLDGVLSHFDLSARNVRAVGSELRRTRDDTGAGPLGAAIWDACRVQTRPRLDGLAQRIPPGATWDDLVLPDAQSEVLREIAAQVRQRDQVYQKWGFAAKGARGFGISALFAGASGTGKTLAAEVLASELRLDLYRVDLSQIVSKYIGETEKNLRRVFNAAEGSGAILLFDEADALFGKRSEVKDSHDRFANIEVSYLLQQMEAYRGLAILTTNMKDALDPAFLRRIRFVVTFPFPHAVQRAEIWRKIFPAATPTENLDANLLAKLNVAGGHIRNIALNAAFRAADEGLPVRMAHVHRALRGEYEKLEKPLTDSETGGWL